MEIELFEVKSKSDLRRFIYLPEKIHKNHKNWLPSLISDDWTLFDPKKNRAFGYCDTILVLARKNGEVVGRIMGIINRKYNEIHNENNARFVFMECFDDKEVFHALISYIEKWAKEKGTSKLIGPFGFSDKDPQGFLVEGFDKPTVMVTNCSLPYMADYIEREGFSQLLDLVQYRVAIPDELPDFYLKILERLNKNGYVLQEFKHIKDVKPYIVPVFKLTNEAFSKIYGYVPYDEKEMNDFANRYLPILNPKFIKLITNKGNEVIAYIIAMPSISEGLRKSKGRLFPFGFIQILRSMKKTKELDLFLGAIKYEYRNVGLDSLLATAMLKSAKEAKLEIIDSHVILEQNTKMRAEIERVGGEIYKRYRIFQKDI
ncbi:MAG: hypothetical protein A2W99_04930 [Bacteroidetes bacterium GWF2_33_16]|nr:MAG: hypothetical protein A2X00_17450 [Bacteroidetes bacterium GWE2_32_14]OFY06011.1 MAG: hypothetical protein A2W99_04930 [Bacteroidetes bacterium GWF2_33_16]